MKSSEVDKIKAGDVLFCNKNNTCIKIIDVAGDKFKIFFNGKTSWRAKGQLARVAGSYDLAKKEKELEKGMLFYDAKKTRIVEISPGSIYLGEV